MNEFDIFPTEYFNQSGLNRQHVFNLAELPAAVQQKLAPQPGERQLILFGHAGRRLWEAVQASGIGGEDPIDDYSIQTMTTWFAQHAPERHFRILYPGDQPIALQALGQLAGWHHAAPFMVGIDAEWGSWFAYRAVVISDTNFQPNLAVDRINPCLSCSAKPCIAACPASAMDDGNFSLGPCLAYRQQADSSCAHTCLARLACPIGEEHRYTAAQMHHSYSRSLKLIRDFKTRR
jgi:hypothetical protein